jgi:isoleucyl-tRNA synthetase
MPPFTTEGVFSHGFVNAADGRKMSKSYNNTIDPTDVRQFVLFVVGATLQNEEKN